MNNFGLGSGLPDLEVRDGSPTYVHQTMSARLAMALIVLGALGVDAAGQDAIDLGRTTCTQFLAMSREQTLIIVGWLHGYFLDEHASPIIDFGKLNADSLKLSERCQSHPDEDVISAADAVFEQ
jgi:acid stress chaperone HdeB